MSATDATEGRGPSRATNTQHTRNQEQNHLGKDEEEGIRKDERKKIYDELIEKGVRSDVIQELQRSVLGITTPDSSQRELVKCLLTVVEEQLQQLQQDMIQQEAELEASREKLQKTRNHIKWYMEAQEELLDELITLI